MNMPEPATPEDLTAELDRLKEAVTKANAEAAKYRVEKKDAVEAAKQEVADSFAPKIAELEAQIEAHKAETVAARTDVQKLTVTIQAGIDADKALDFADLLKGENEEELKSHAETLKSLFTQDEGREPTRAPATDPSQGNAGNKPLPLNGDPLLAALTKAVNR